MMLRTMTVKIEKLYHDRLAVLTVVLNVIENNCTNVKMQIWF